MIQVKGIIGRRANVALHEVPEVVMQSFSDPMDMPAVLPWAENPVNLSWSRFFAVSAPIFNFLDPWDKLYGPEGEVRLQRWIFFPRHRVGNGVTIWANLNLRDIPMIRQPDLGWTDPQVDLIFMKRRIQIKISNCFLKKPIVKKSFSVGN